MSVYRLTLKGGKVQELRAAILVQWLKDRKEAHGATFDARLEQLRKLTKLDIVDWELD